MASLDNAPIAPIEVVDLVVGRFVGVVPWSGMCLMFTCAPWGTGIHRLAMMSGAFSSCSAIALSVLLCVYFSRSTRPKSVLLYIDSLFDYLMLGVFMPGFIFASDYCYFAPLSSPHLMWKATISSVFRTWVGGITTGTIVVLFVQHPLEYSGPVTLYREISMAIIYEAYLWWHVVPKGAPVGGGWPWLLVLTAANLIGCWLTFLAHCFLFALCKDAAGYVQRRKTVPNLPWAERVCVYNMQIVLRIFPSGHKPLANVVSFALIPCSGFAFVRFMLTRNISGVDVDWVEGSAWFAGNFTMGYLMSVMARHYNLRSLEERRAEERARATEDAIVSLNHALNEASKAHKGDGVGQRVSQALSDLFPGLRAAFALILEDPLLSQGQDSAPSAAAETEVEARNRPIALCGTREDMNRVAAHEAFSCCSMGLGRAEGFSTFSLDAACRTQQEVDSRDLGLSRYADWVELEALLPGTERVATVPLFGPNGNVVGGLFMAFEGPQAMARLDRGTLLRAAGSVSHGLRMRILEKEMRARMVLLEDFYPRNIIQQTLRQAYESRTGMESGSGAPEVEYRASAPGIPLETGRTSISVASASASISTKEEGVSIMFVDLVGYTEASNRISPALVMSTLNSLYSDFDSLLDLFGIYKIDTIGDCYMCATGLQHMRQDAQTAARNLIYMGGEIIRRAGRYSFPGQNVPIRVRVGVATGECQAGIMGNVRRKFTCMGSCVNLAQRMESTGVPGMLHLHESTIDAAGLSGSPYLEYRESVHLKGLGLMNTYTLHPASVYLALGTPSILRVGAAPAAFQNRRSSGRAAEYYGPPGPSLSGHDGRTSLEIDPGPLSPRSLLSIRTTSRRCSLSMDLHNKSADRETSALRDRMALVGGPSSGGLNHGGVRVARLSAALRRQASAQRDHDVLGGRASIEVERGPWRPGRDAGAALADDAFLRSNELIELEGTTAAQESRKDI